MKADLAIYGSHNASAVLAIDGRIELVLELERFLNHKNVGIFFYFSADTSEYVCKWLADYFFKHYGISSWESVTGDYIDPEILRHHFPAKSYFEADHPDMPVLHHAEHAWGSLFQSPHEEALIFSFDGGGRDGVFNIYVAEQRGEVFDRKASVGLDLGFAYMSFGDVISEIRHEPLWYGNLVYPGKLMGLCAYGEVNEDWFPHFMEYYRASPEGPTYKGHLETLGSQIGIPLDGDRVEGQQGRDIAATSQKAFEETFLEIVREYLDEYPEYPVHLTGGCALNIILNTRLVEEFGREVFVSPNPSDCGIAVGMLCQRLKPVQPVDITYAGLPVMDEDTLYAHVERHAGKRLDLESLAHDLNAGKIVGVVRGRAEHGPRALGNRSILCDPSIPGMKDILNEKVKHRESYRPFAPVVRLEDVNTFFEWDRESRWMSFCPRVREEWREQLGAIVHADGTARVQTVTAPQNPWLYRLLTKFSEINNGVGVLLNTSFNTRGRPILSSYHDAIEVYRREQLDCLVLGDFYLAKHKYCPPDFS